MTNSDYGAGQGSDTPGWGSPQQPYGTPQPGYGSAQPGYGSAQPGYGAPQQPYGTPGYGAPAGWGGQQPPAQPASWLLQLSSGARGLLTTFMVLGVVFLVGYIVVFSMFVSSAAKNAAAALPTLGTTPTSGSVTPTANAGDTGTATASTGGANGLTATMTLSNDFITFGKEFTAVGNAETACGQSVSCLVKQAGIAATDLTNFNNQLKAIQVPANAAADKAKLVADIAAMDQAFTQLSHATSGDQYASITASSGLGTAASNMQTDADALISKLTGA